jgi:hypothetical protein
MGYNRPVLFNHSGLHLTDYKEGVCHMSEPRFLRIVFLIGLITVLGTGPGDATEAPSDGYNLFSPIGSTTTYLMNNDGTMVHSWTSAYRPGQSVYLLEDSTLLRTANTQDATFNAGGAGGRVEQFNWDGARQWEFEYRSDQHRLHHDIEVLPNGNVLMIAWEMKTAAEAVAAGRNPSLLTDELWPDHVIEVAPTGTSGGTIVWEWHVWDHLIQDYDEAKGNYGNVGDHPELIDLNYASTSGADWNHINAVDYNVDLDQIVLSVHGFSEIWVIDHSTTTSQAASHSGGNSGKGGDLLYRWGSPRTYDSGSTGDQQLFVQHDAEWIEAGLPGEGNILIFNNGQGRSEGNYSSVDEIVPPINSDGSYALAVGAAYGPDASVWCYTATPLTDFYAQNISGAQRLPNGNTLICQGPDGLFFEVTASGDKVWEYDYAGAVFRVERYSPDYAGFVGTDLEPSGSNTSAYPVVDTDQSDFYNASVEISQPSAGQPFYGQDAQYAGNTQSYTNNGDGTITDNITALMWQQSPDTDGDGNIDADDKLTYDEAVAGASTLNLGGHTDWRLPTIKELYSLIEFSGIDPSSYQGTDTSGLVPFMDTAFFDFAYGDTSAGERIIDAQYASTTKYVSTTMNGNETMFGVNFADGRIKGYGLSLFGSDKTFFVIYVRGNTGYGQNDFTDNGDGTISDNATGLMWARNDSGTGLNWEEALAWVQTKNSENYLGQNDWRLPNTKELQSIVDYTRSPDTTNSAAIDPLFNATSITNEAGQTDYPCYWSNTTHANMSAAPGANAAYVAFGRAMGYMNGSWIDVHGAGAQRSDPKSGDPADWPTGHGPQGDAIRIYNYVRLVRDVSGAQTTDAYVNKNDGTCSGNSPCYLTIQEGIDAAVDGSTVNIARGTYTESLLLNSPKTVTLKGGWDDIFSAQESNTTVIKAPKVANGTLKMQNVVIRP